jgi:uncharacterized protein YpmB
VSKFITGRQWFIIWIVTLLVIFSSLIATIVLAFQEAGHNRVKEQRMFNACIASKQTALECRVAIRGTGN